MPRPVSAAVLRYALVGCGDIGRLRADAIRRTPGASLACVADEDRARAEAVARPSGARVLARWQDALAADDVDVVVVSTPPWLHAEMTIAALEAGKHVLCEKPLARTAREGAAMLAAEATSPGRLFTGFNYRFYPSIVRARELLDAGRIGPLTHVRAYAGYSATGHNRAWVHEGDACGGGALRDNGVHLLDLTRWFMGEVAEVAGMASGATWGFAGCEDNGFALFRGERGTIATLHASWTEWRRYQFQLELFGPLGVIRASCFPMTTEVTWAAERAGRTRREIQRFPLVMLGEHAFSYRWVVVRSFVEEHAALAAALRGEPSAIGTGHDGLRALEIAEAATAGFDAAPAAAGSASYAAAAQRPAVVA